MDGDGGKAGMGIAVWRVVRHGSLDIEVDVVVDLSKIYASAIDARLEASVPIIDCFDGLQRAVG